MTRIRTRTWRRCLRLTLSAVVTAVVVVGCGVADVDGRRPDASRSGGTACAGTIGLIAPLSGPAAAVGAPIADAADLAVDQAPAHCDIRLLRLDSEADPGKAAAIAAKIAADETYLGVVGPMTSGEVRATKGTFAEGGVTVISPAATATDLTTEDPADTFHRVVVRDEVQGRAIGRYLLATHARRVFVVDDGGAYGAPLADQVVAVAGDVVTGRDRVQPGQTDFSATVSKVRGAGAGVVFYAGYANEAGPFLRQLRGSGVEARFVGGDGLFGGDFVTAAGRRTAEGAVVTCPCQPTTMLRAARQFSRVYEARYHRAPGAWCAEAYDATHVLVEALAAGSRTREAVEAYVDDYDQAGITKRIRFDRQGDLVEDSAVVWAYRITGGRPVPDREIPLG
jgi:branched-chain amino acid transport system substrate-binding protein